MNIKIIRKSNAQLMEQSKISLELSYKINSLSLLCFSLVGLASLVYGCFLDRSGTQFWNVFSFIGVGMLLSLIIAINRRIQAKEKFFAKVVELIRKQDMNNSVTEITISEIGITYKNFETYSEINWSHYKFYKFYKNYLFLFTDKNVFSNLAIRSDELTTEEFDSLMNFLKSRLLERR